MELDIKFICGKDNTNPPTKLNNIEEDEDSNAKISLIDLLDALETQDAPAEKPSKGCFSLNLFCLCFG